MLADPVTAGRNFDWVLRALESLRLPANHPVATSVHRKRGNDVITAGSASNGHAEKIHCDGWKELKPYVHSFRSRSEAVSVVWKGSDPRAPTQWRSTVTSGIGRGAGRTSASRLPAAVGACKNAQGPVGYALSSVFAI